MDNDELSQGEIVLAEFIMSIWQYLIDDDGLDSADFEELLELGLTIAAREHQRSRKTLAPCSSDQS